jgi:hypothetical protein
VAGDRSLADLPSRDRVLLAGTLGGEMAGELAALGIAHAAGQVMGLTAINLACSAGVEGKLIDPETSSIT